MNDAAVQRLAAYLGDLGLATNGPLQVTVLSGGQSNPTYRVVAGSDTYVLRKKPPGKLLPGAHAIDREYRVMKALAGTEVPVPEMLAYCEDESVLGTAFYLMPFLDGRVYFDQTLPDLSPADRRAFYLDMNRVMAALHRVDPAAIGLADYGKAGNYFARQIGRWSRQYQEDPGDRIPEIELLIDWLGSRIPAGEDARIVHGDYRLDNVMLDPAAPRVIAVLDWELSTLGHPLADFSYHCMSWHIPPSLWRGIGGLDLQALGIPEQDEYIDLYVKATGLTQAREHWDFYLAYNFFRIAAILHGIGQRARKGNAASDDAMEMAARAQPLAALGWQFAQQYDAQR
ncbi:phosphotransferase family protein [Orrella marina]|uniref:Phosphotransferase family protein n=1 Tax=Orrella marina TaxID=2163011 RepID=A0A2R4XNV5_9BURK|nr:phosphotransferase family protein [Orrella marina]AWB35486.1 phosphotransferase family protein [Orrella marina]